MFCKLIPTVKQIVFFLSALYIITKQTFVELTLNYLLRVSASTSGAFNSQKNLFHALRVYALLCTEANTEC